MIRTPRISSLWCMFWLTMLTLCSTGCLRDARQCTQNSECFTGETCSPAGACIAPVQTTQDMGPLKDQGGTSITCPSGTPLLCGDRCVNAQDDPKACGGCETQCGSGNVCDSGKCKNVGDCTEPGAECTGLTWCDQSDGKCKPGCDSNEQCGDGERCNRSVNRCECKKDLQRCSGTCVAQSVSACGASCRVCQGDENGAASCDEGMCKLTCDDGFRECGGRCVACPGGMGVEATACLGSGDQASCVATACLDGYEPCENQCAKCPDGAQSTGCQGPTCIASDCGAGNKRCDGKCTTCPSSANSTSVCEADTCVIRCDAGFHLCNGQCVSDADVNSCGDRCEACPGDPNGVAVCLESKSCDIECNMGSELCNGVCAKCPDGPNVLTTACDAGACVATSCDSAAIPCGGVCALCPSSPGIATVACSVDMTSCVVEQCSPGFMPCLGGCCPGAMPPQTGIVDGAMNDVGEFVSLALDAQDYPHLSYHDATNNTLKYAHWDGSAWVFARPDASNLVGKHTSIQVDSSGSPHISYHDGGKDQLKYATMSQGVWKPQFIDTQIGTGTYSSLVLGGSGLPSVSYFDSVNGELRVTQPINNMWLPRVVKTNASPRDIGKFSSIAQGSMGTVHVSALDLENFSVLYATSPSSAGQPYVVENANPAGDTVPGEWISIALDASDAPSISYFNPMTKDLEYVTKSGGMWKKSLVDTVGDVGEYTSIAIDGAGTPHVSYYDRTNSGLKYATRVNGTWQVTSVDTMGDVGQFTSIAIDSQGKPHIAYYDVSNKDVRYTYFNGTVWLK